MMNEERSTNSSGVNESATRVPQDSKQPVQQQQVRPRLFAMPNASELAALEEGLLKELDIIPAEKFADSASNILEHYVESKNFDANVYYESKYKPLEQDSANNSDAYQKMMSFSKVIEYGSNFDKSVYDPTTVVATPDELLDNILRRSVNKGASSVLSRASSNTVTAQQNALNILNRVNNGFPQPMHHNMAQQSHLQVPMWGYMGNNQPPY